MTDIYARLDADGGVTELNPAGPVTTTHIVVTTLQESYFALAPVGSVTACEVLHAPGALLTYNDGDLARYRIARVERPTAPEGQVLAGYTLTRAGDLVTAEGSFEAAPPPPVPGYVTNVQAKLALDAAGLLDAAEAAVAAAPRATQIYWASAAGFHRDHPVLADIAAALDPPLDDAAVDDLFRDAATR